MEHDEVKGKLYRCCLGNVMISDELLAEFDRLKSEVDRLQGTPAAKLYAQQLAGVGELRDRCRILQSWLDRISGPYDAKYHFDLDWIESQLHEKGYWYASNSLRAIRNYLDSQKPSEKSSGDILHYGDYQPFDSLTKHVGPKADCPICNPPKCEHKNGGISYYSEGVLRQWCDDCKEWIAPKSKCEHKNRGETMENFGYYRFWCNDCKEWIYTSQPLTQCPECMGAMKVIDSGQIWIEDHYEPSGEEPLKPCSCCRGQGVI